MTGFAVSGVFLPRDSSAAAPLVGGGPVEITSKVGIQLYKVSTLYQGEGGMCAAEIGVWILGVNFLKASVVLALAKIFPPTIMRIVFTIGEARENHSGKP